MASIQQIKQDLDALEQNVAEISEEIQKLYAYYLNVLDDSLQKQLILASYHICTQIYPDSFLRLSLSQRQKLQQNLRQLSKEIESKLLSYLQPSRSLQANQNAENLELVEAMIKNLPFVENPEAIKEELLKLDLENATAEQEEEFPEEEISTESEETVESLPEKQSESKDLANLDLRNPNNLILWQKGVEKGIQQSLDEISRQANHSLQQADIIPNRFPSKIIDVAIQAEEAGSIANKVHNFPNILNIVVETDKNQKSSQANITQISLLRLRLSEIEFSDPLLNVERGKIRNLLKKVQKLKQQYQAKQREYAQAEAEAAWRSSWYED